MNTVVRFDNISKRYNLGLARTSVPTIISQWLKTRIGRAPHSSSEAVLFWALRDVSFDLVRGQSLALIGSNGAGKTTILKLLANITKPTSGQLTINGKLSALIELGAGFHADLTGRENIFLNGTILGLSRKEIERRFEEIVDFSELERFIDTPVKRYSSGMTVRLGFAVASCIQPDILLVDEVLAVGDAAFQQKCLRRIRSLIENGTSIVFVSHNLYLVQAACNIALYLQKGQVKHYGTIKDVIDMYENDIHKERASKFDEMNQQRDGGDGDIDITGVEIATDDEVVTNVFHSNRTAQIRINYNAYKSLGKTHVEVFIFRSDGATCCMMRTKLAGFNVFVERGQGVITVELTPLQLVGGAYYVEASFLDESDSLIISSKVGRSDWFTVQGSALSYNESSIFEPISHWSHGRNGEAAETDGAGKRAGDL